MLIPVFYNLPVNGNKHVTVNDGSNDEKSFVGLTDKIKSIVWMDSNEELSFEQKGESLCIESTGYVYGTNYCVRVAKAIIDKENMD